MNQIADRFIAVNQSLIWFTVIGNIKSELNNQSKFGYNYICFIHMFCMIETRISFILDILVISRGALRSTNQAAFILRHDSLH